MKSSLKFIIALLLVITTVALVACGEGDVTTGPEGGPAVTTTGGSGSSDPGDKPGDDTPGQVVAADEYTLKPGGTVTLETDVNVSVWMSSDSTIVSVDDKGKVKAVSAGYATVKGKALTGETVTYIFNVYDFKISYDEEAEEVTECTLDAVLGSAHELVIPAEIQGLKVTALGANAIENFTRLKTLSFEEGSAIKTIGNDAFKGCSLLETVTLPETVEEIGTATFAFCTSLKSFNVPSKVTAISDGMFYGCTSMTSYTVPAHVTAIGKYAFAQCTGIKEFTIPDTVESIGVRLFYYATSLEKITVGSGITELGASSFYGCSSLKTVKLPATLETIGSYAFGDCTALSTLDIPATVTAIGARAFWNCSKIESLTLPAALTAVSDGMLSGTSLKSIALPKLVASIGAYAFDGCTKLESITVEGALTSISEAAFRGCDKLTTIDLSKGIASIGAYAFEGCSKLATASLAADLTNIGVGAFKDTAIVAFTAGKDLVSVGKDAFAGTPWFTSQADGLVYIGNLLYTYKGNMPENTELVIKDGTLYISEGALAGNRNLVAVTVPASVTKIGFGAFASNHRLATLTLPFVGDGGEENTHIAYLFGGAKLEDNATVIPASFKKVIYTGKVVPANAFNGCLTIEEVVLTAAEKVDTAAFYGCYGLKTLDLGKSVKTIGETAFYGCRELTEITLGDNVTELGLGAFQACLGAEKITVGAGLKVIPESAFADCTSLKELVIAEGVTEIAKSAFQKCSQLETINLPDSVYNIGETAFHDTAWYRALPADQAAYVGKVLYTVKGAPADTTLTIKDGTKGVAFGAVAGLTAITKLELPDSLVCIGADAFKGLGITEIEIGESVKVIGDGAFADCATLNKITVYQASADKANAMYSVVDTVRFGGATVDYILKADDYNVKFENGGYTITKYTGDATELDVIAEYNDGVNGWKPVLAVGANAFAGNTDLTKVTFTSDIVSIGAGAFKGCTGLVERFEIPASVTYLGDSAFEGCSSISSLSLNSEKFDYVGAAVFKNCSSLTTTIIGSGLDKVTDSMFEGCEKLSTARVSNALTVGKNAYKGCTSLTTVAFSKATAYGESAFEGCTKLTTLNIHADLETIGRAAFKGCEALANLTVASGVKTIGAEAFMNCAALTKITLPASVTSIGDYAFKGCSAATTIQVNGTGDSGSYTVGKYAFEGCSAVTTVSVSKGYATVSEGMFKDCTSIKTFSIVGTVNKVESNAFAGCTALEKIIFYGHSVDSLDAYKAKGGSVAGDAFPAGFANFEFTN